MSVYHLIEIKFADPVSYLAINEKYVLSGTMMGRLSLFSIFEKKHLLLAEFSTENITGINFLSDEVFNVAIGDDELVRYMLSYYDNQLTQESFRNKIYEDEHTHKAKCDGNFTLLWMNQLLLLNLPSTEGGNSVISQDTEASVKNNYNSTFDEHKINMTNYSVPFDYDGKKFLWVEFLEEKERNLCVYYFETKSTFKHKLKKEFGHISHCKLILGNKIVLVRLQNIVEIREIIDFKLLRTFTNIGEEVIGIDVYINQSKILLQEPLNEIIPNQNYNNLNINNNSEKKNDPQYLKIENMKKDHVVVGINEENVFNEENLSVVLLDIDGNVNVWENLNVMTKFNLYNLNDMAIEYKNKQFFSMGYPYYIKMNSNYFAVSTDHGVFVIKKLEN